jgi:hypothetical protein
MKLVFFCLFIFPLTLFPQSYLGSYKSANGSTLNLGKKNTFNYHKKYEWKRMPVIDYYSISEGEYKISDNLILFKSKYDLTEKINNNLIINQNSINSDDNIVLQIDKLSNDFNIYICNVYSEEYDSILNSWSSNFDNCLKLDKINKIKKQYFGEKIYFKIYPKYESSFMRIYQFNLTYLKTKEFEFDKGKNIEILFTEPNIDLFYYQNFENEIALIEKDYIFFKGEKFYKLEEVKE